MHPHHAHRQHKVEHTRVAHITKGYASGGAVHHDEAQDRKLMTKVINERDAQAVTGKPARQRLDRPQRAKGGRVKGKHKGVNVNVMVAPQGGNHPPMPMPMPMPAGGPPMAGPPAAMPPRPPMAAPPPMAGAGAAPGMPPGAPIRHSGGRTYAKGGRVSDGPAFKEGLRNGTQVQHSDGKSDGANIGRGRVVTFRTGGKVEARGRKTLTPHLPGGSGGGEARLTKERMAKRSKNGMAP